jgi:AraC-like DNA-binding protein
MPKSTRLTISSRRSAAAREVHSDGARQQRRLSPACSSKQRAVGDGGQAGNSSRGLPANPSAILKRSPSWSRTSSCACRAIFGAAGRRRRAPLLFGSGVWSPPISKSIWPKQYPFHVLAKVVHLSAYYFCRAFKQSFGIPLDRYHINRRIERAKMLLANPGPSETTSRSSWASAKRARSRRRSDTRLGPLQSTTAAPWHEAARSQERRPKPAQQHLAGPKYVASRHKTRCKLLDAHVGKADTLGGACGRSRQHLTRH